MNPLVTIIVLCYNQAEWALEALQSVEYQLDTYDNIEVIIVDDCSTDNSVKVIQRWILLNEGKFPYPIRFIGHTKNMGVCKAINNALKISKGKYVSMLACDDYLLADKIRYQVEMMELPSNKCGVLYSNSIVIDKNNIALGTFTNYYMNMNTAPSGNIFKNLVKGGHFISATAAMVKRSVYDDIGLYDENLKLEDYDMWLRISRKYEFFYIHRPHAVNRIHGNNFSVKLDDWDEQRIMIFSKHLSEPIVVKKLMFVILGLIRKKGLIHTLRKINEAYNILHRK